MKKMLARMDYMAFGYLLTLIGFHFGNIDSNSADAQFLELPQETEIVDEIKCRKIVVVGDDDTPRISLGTDLYDCGEIQIYNEDEEFRISLGVLVNLDSDLLHISGRTSDGCAIRLGTEPNGGHIVLYHKALRSPVIRVGITYKGKGFIDTRDKVGGETGFIGPEEVLRYYGIERN